MESSFIIFIVQCYPEAALHHGKGKGGLKQSDKADFTIIPDSPSLAPVFTDTVPYHGFATETRTHSVSVISQSKV